MSDTRVCRFSAGARGEQLSEDPGFALLHVRAAVLPGVSIRRWHACGNQGHFVFKYVTGSRFDARAAG